MPLNYFTFFSNAIFHIFCFRFYLFSNGFSIRQYTDFHRKFDCDSLVLICVIKTNVIASWILLGFFHKLEYYCLCHNKLTYTPWHCIAFIKHLFLCIRLTELRRKIHVFKRVSSWNEQIVSSQSDSYNHFTVCKCIFFDKWYLDDLMENNHIKCHKRWKTT